MAISSRTPEGEPAECPVCGAFVKVEPSLFFSDAPCPSCGSLLWFVRLNGLGVFLQPSDAARRKGFAKALSELTGLDADQLREEPESLGRAEVDSLHLVELVMALEDEPPDEMDG